MAFGLSDKKTNVLTLTFLVTGLIISTSVIFYLLGENVNRDLIDIIEVVGSIFSTFAFAITLVQILAIRKNSEIALEAAEEARNKIRVSRSIVSAKEAVLAVATIEKLLGRDDIMEAKQSITDLKGMVLEFVDLAEFLPDVVPLDHVDRLKGYVDQLAKFDAELFDVLHGDKKENEVRTHEMITVLQEISTDILYYQNRLHYLL